MRRAAREDYGVPWAESARESSRGRPDDTLEQTLPGTRAWTDQLLRRAPSTAGPAQLLLLVGLLVLTVDVVRLVHVGQTPETAGVQATIVVETLATGQSAPVALQQPTIAAIPTVALWAAADTVARVVPGPPAPAPTRSGAPTATPAPEITSASPEGAVRAFYDLLFRRDFQAVVSLFSARMHATVPSDPGFLRDRAPPGQLTIQQLTVVSVNTAKNNATVAVDVVEQLSPAVARRYVGTWKLVRGPAGWLLDESDIHLE